MKLGEEVGVLSPCPQNGQDGKQGKLEASRLPECAECKKPVEIEDGNREWTRLKENIWKSEPRWVSRGSGLQGPWVPFWETITAPVGLEGWSQELSLEE